MSPLAKLRPRSRSTAVLATETVGNALVVHAHEGMSAEARSLASALPADPDNDLVVADPPPESASTYWDSFAASLPRGRRGLRVVFANRSRELGALAGHWLSTRLGRTVLAPDGVQSRDLNGSVFVDAGAGSGWMRFRPGREPEREGKRFPQPSWESPAVAESFRAGPASTAEPLPSGLWLRPNGDKPRLDANRNRLTHAIPCQPDILTVVLGGRDLAELPLDDVVPVWQALPAADRPKVRFVHFGPVAVSRNRPLFPALADLLDEEITCYTGIPVGQTDVYLLRPDGSHGWNAFVQQLSYVPGVAAPRLRVHRAPVAGLPEIGPVTYEYAPDVVVEIVPAGLWIRPPDAPAHADAVRGTPVDPATNMLLYEDSDPVHGSRLWTVTQELLDRLDYSTRLASRAVPTTAVCTPMPTAPPAAREPLDPAEVLLPWLTELLDTESLPKPSPSPDKPVTLTVSSPKQAVDVTTTPPKEDMDAARAWVRENWPDEFGERADPLRAMLTNHPKLVTGSREDALVDAVALRMYLTGRAPELDAGLRSGEDGPHVRLARCAVAALMSLPPHRGSTAAALTPTPEQWEFYRQHKVLSEWGFHTMLAAPCSAREGEADVFVWSMTGRRTRLFEDTEQAVDGRVVFPPGTCFKVLDLTEGEAGGRARILLRELSSTEIGTDGKVDENRRSLDQLARTSLLRFADKPATRGPVAHVPAALAPNLFRLPGTTDE